MLGCRPLTDEEFTVAAASFRGRHGLRDRLLFVLGVTTGFRISELLSLRFTDVIRNGAVAQQVRVARRHTKGKRSSRAVPLAPLARRELARFIQHEKAADTFTPARPVFLSQKGEDRAMTRIQAYRILRAAFDAAGIPLDCPGTHTMRKTYARAMYTQLDENLFKVQRALGHASPASTIRYLDWDDSETTAAVSAAWPAIMLDSEPDTVHDVHDVHENILTFPLTETPDACYASHR